MIDVFRIGVHIGMTTNTPQVLGTLIQQLGLVHGNLNQIIAKLGKFKMLIGGAAAAVVGTKALEGLWHIVEASRELNKELNRTKQLGGDFAATINSARMTAFRTSFAVPTSTPAENVRVQRELATQLQSPAAAETILPYAQRAAYVISNFTGEHVEDIIKNLVKVADIRAQIFTHDASGKEVVDPAKVQSEFEAAARGLILAGNYLKSGDLVQMARQAGVPVKGMTQEAFYANMIEMAVSQGASRTGTAVTSLFSQLVGGTMPVHVAQEMERMGLMHHGEWGSDHGHVVMKPAVTDRLQGIQSDPIGFITGPLDAMLTAKGMTSQDKLLEVFKLFGRQTTQRLVAEAFSSEPQFERARHMFHEIPDTGAQYKMLQSEDLDTNIKSFQAAWQGLMQALGEQGVPVAIGIIHRLVDAMHAVTAWAIEHPETSKILFETAAGLAALAAVGGTLVLAAAALAPFTLALRALLGVLNGGAAAAAGARALAAGIAGLVAQLGKGVGGLSIPPAAFMAGGIAGLTAGALYLGYKGAQGTGQNIARAAQEGRRVLTTDEFGNPTSYSDPIKPTPPPGQPSAFIPPSAPAATPPVQNIQLRGNVMIDGRKFGEYQANELARGLSGPSTGTTGFDVRTGATGGMAGAATP